MRVLSTWLPRAAAIASLFTVALGASATAASAWSPPPRPQTLYVSNATRGHACSPAPFTTIQAAVNAATPGSRIIVCPGTYDEGVLVSKRLTLDGWNATIDASASSFGNGVHIDGAAASGSSVEGFKIENAKFEGILVGTAPIVPTEEEGKETTEGEPVSNVRIVGNVVVHDDAGFGTPAGQCYSTPEAPGDCGEAIHLVSVTKSVVGGNYVSENAGGILLTDEFGPNSGNIVWGNQSIRNESDCGITLASHRAAVNPETLQPTGAYGVFDNTIVGNVSSGNGTTGQGAGILMGGGTFFSAVYGNVIRGNLARGNGLAGVTLHQHFPGDFNGNVIEDNTLLENNLDGDDDFEAAQASETTDILIASGKPAPPLPPTNPVEGTIVRDNFIGAVKVGIWTLNADTSRIEDNWFGYGVLTRLSTH